MNLPEWDLQISWILIMLFLFVLHMNKFPLFKVTLVYLTLDIAVILFHYLAFTYVLLYVKASLIWNIRKRWSSYLNWASMTVCRNVYNASLNTHWYSIFCPPYIFTSSFIFYTIKQIRLTFLWGLTFVLH